jgi:hypothetical protein
MLRPALLLAAALAPAARGQDGPLDLRGGMPTGPRTSVTERRAVLGFDLVNPALAPRDARITVYYDGRPAELFSRDVWVPGRAMVTTWLPVGPAPAQPFDLRRDINMVLADRTAGRTVLRADEERVRNRLLPYRRREPTTALLTADAPDPDPPQWPARHSASTRAFLAVRALRKAAGLPDAVAVPGRDFLPPAPDALDGVDHVVLADDRLAADPVGRAALRRWVIGGGKLWVMLDRVNPDDAAAIAGDDFDLRVIDRVGLTVVEPRRTAGGTPEPPRAVEEPVELVRVALPPGVVPLHTADGWPVTIVRPVGRGKVIYTALAADGWVRPPARPGGAVEPVPALSDLMLELTSTDTPPVTADDLRPLLAAEIGYAVPDRRTAAAVLGGFVLALAAVGLAARRWRRPEAAGWLGPAVAVGAAGAFVLIGQAARQAVPATAAAAMLVEPAAGTGEATSAGTFAVYSPDSGPVALSSADGTMLDVDATGLAGTPRRRVQTDIDRWHLEGLALPAGVRGGPFRTTVPAAGLEAVARFGPAGVEGRLSPGPFADPADAILMTPSRQAVPVRLAADGTFTPDPDPPPGQLLAGAVLSDRQLRRQAVYAKWAAAATPLRPDGPDLLLVWATPPGLPFATGRDDRTIGAALLALPIRYERPAPGTRVVVPRPLVPFRKLTLTGLGPPTLESIHPADQTFRFQLPPAVLPLAVERATLALRIRAPLRTVTVYARDGAARTPVAAVSGPLDPIRSEMTDARLLRPDARGGLLLDVEVGPAVGGDAGTRWAIESVGLEVAGRTAGP